MPMQCVILVLLIKNVEPLLALLLPSSPKHDGLKPTWQVSPYLHQSQHLSAIITGLLLLLFVGGLADLRKSLEHGLGLPVSHPTLEILLNEQADLKVNTKLHMVKTPIMHMFTSCQQLPYPIALCKSPYTYQCMTYTVQPS